MNEIFDEILELLKELIQTPSLSCKENITAEILYSYISAKGYKVHRKGNNLWIFNNNLHEGLPTILLNSHHDTIKPSNSWTKDPFNPEEIDGKLFGLGSNDAGASLVSLLAAFLLLDIEEKPYNLAFAATVEEEISGKNGFISIIEELGKIDFVIVGEPTNMQMAIAEKGLMVLDCIAIGKAGHAARSEGVNAIYFAMQDIEWLKNYKFPKTSDLLGEVKLNVTQINAGHQHNIVPDKCSFVVDVRSNEMYTNEEIYNIIKDNLKSNITARSFHLNSSSIELSHPVVKQGLSMGLKYFGSLTTSDQAVIPWKSIKIGPGDSARSHSADEFVFIDEIKDGIKIYIELLKNLNI